MVSMGNLANGSLAMADSMAVRRELLRPLSDKKYSTLASFEDELELVEEEDFGAAAVKFEVEPPNENGAALGAEEERGASVVDNAVGGLKLKAGAGVVPLNWDREDEAAEIEAPNS